MSAARAVVDLLLTVGTFAIKWLPCSPRSQDMLLSSDVVSNHSTDVRARCHHAGAVADVHVLRGLAAPAASGDGGGEAKSPQPSWTPLEASGTAPAPRKGHAIAGWEHTKL